MKQYLFFGVSFLLASSYLLAQGEKENNLIADGNQGYQNEAYVEAEADYRKALSINNSNVKAQHNIGNSLYRTKDFDQANQRYFQTQKNSLNKVDKHLAFHNMGNGFMQQKNYEKAVEAYKGHIQDYAENCIRRMISEINDGKAEIGNKIEVNISSGFSSKSSLRTTRPLKPFITFSFVQLSL